MSGNRKIGKRSIIGSVVAVQTQDGFWRRGSVVGIRNTEDRLMPFEKNYEIELTDGKFGDKYFCEDDIYGHGFNTSIPQTTKLLPGQCVFVTHEGREVKGRIQTHSTEQDVLTVELERDKVIFKTLEDIRLLESRKSARLGKSVLDFSKLAEMGHPYQRIQTDNKNRRRLHSMSSFIDAKQDLSKLRKRQQSSLLPYTSTLTSDRIDVPQSRKRRTSESLLSDAESGYLSSGGSSSWGINGSYPNGHILSSSFKSRDELRDCTAAMVLMNLSTSPLQHSLHSGNVSPTGSTSTPHPSPVPFQVRMVEEEGPARKCARSVGVMYKCTWRGCLEISADQNKMERHVRGHLGRREPLPGEERDMEEEFYYNEIELDVNILNQDTETQDILEADFVIDTSEHSDSTDTDSLEEKQSYIIIDTTAAPRPTKSPRLEFSPQERSEKKTIFPGESLLATSAPPSLSFIPENQIFRSQPSAVDHKNIVFHKLQPHPNISEHFDMVKSPPPSTSPILLVSSPPSPTSYTSVISPNQMITTTSTSAAWNPKKLISIIPKPENVLSNQPFIFSTPNQVSGMVRSDKKCRKLYGLEQKDLWCTQCKWKKACARFN